MKKVLLILLMSFFMLPLVVSADETDIKIKSVELVEKSDDVIEVESAKFENLEVWFNLKFFELNDQAKYKIVISNNSTDDYDINENNQDFSNEKYINYVFEYNDNDMIIKAGTEEVIFVSIIYKNEVSSEDYVNNVYQNDNHMNLSFSKNANVENPNTNDSLMTFVVIIGISIVLLVICSLKFKKAIYGVAALVLLIPTVSNAMKLFEINIHAKVLIEKKAELGAFSLCRGTYQFETGMTLAEWFESEYNTSGYENYGNILGPTGLYIIEINGSFEEVILTDGVSYSCRNIAECVSPTSKILMDLKGNTKLAMNIEENDKVVYYDFDTNTMKLGTVEKVYVHKDATNFIRYNLEDGSYVEATDYHPIYTSSGWKSYTNRNGYESPVIGDKVKTSNGYKEIIKIETYSGQEDFYDFMVISSDGEKVDNYFANGILVHSAY